MAYSNSIILYIDKLILFVLILNYMDYSTSDKLFSKKNIITYLILAIFILAIPLGVKLVQTQTKIQSRAQVGGEIKIPKRQTQEFDQQCDSSGDNCTTSKQRIQIEIKSP